MANGDRFTLFDSYLEDNQLISLTFGAPGSEQLKLCTNLMKAASDFRLSEEVENSESLLQYGPTNGAARYLHAIQNFLACEFSDVVFEDDLLLTSGASSGLQAIMTFLYPVNRCLVFAEEVTYFLAKSMLHDDYHFPLVPVKIESDGVDIIDLEIKLTAHLTSTNGKPKTDTLPQAVIYLIPAYQNPTGVCLSVEKFPKIVQLARRLNVLVICDDVYNFLYYHHKKPLNRLFAFDNKNDADYKGNVISLGTFSKILGPGLRLGWMEVPFWFKKIWENSGYLRSGGALNHYTSELIATALEMGLVQKFLENIRRDFKVSLNAVCELLREFQMKDKLFDFTMPQGGYFIWIVLKNKLAADVLKKAKEYHVTAFPGAIFSISDDQNKFGDCIRISFAYYRGSQLLEAVRRLCQAIADS